MRAGFGVGERVVMVSQIEAAGGGDCLKLVVGESAAEVAPGGGKSVEELVVRVVHLIDLEGGFEAAFVEAAIVGYQRKSFNQRRYLFPDIRKYRSIPGVFLAESVDLLAEPFVVLRFGVDEAIVRVDDLPAAHDNNSYAAHARGLLVSRLEIYCCEISH